jgi:osmotically-inducible protein OsmY
MPQQSSSSQYERIHSASDRFGVESDSDHRALEYAERPHGWGGYERNYDVADSGWRRIDAPREASHRGRGPKDYRRRDERTYEIVCERLMDDPRIDASEIEVVVQSGEITLTGSVPDRWTKYAVEDLVETCTGVQITNKLRVLNRERDSAWSDAEWPIGS